MLRLVPAGCPEPLAGGPAVRGRRGPEAGDRGQLLQGDAAAGTAAQLAHTDERWAGVATAFGVFRVAGRGLAGRDIQQGEADCVDPQERRGHGFCLQPVAARGRCCGLDRRGGERTGELHPGLRYRYGCGEAGRHSSRGQHGHPGRDPPGHHPVHPLQGRRPDAGELQHLCGRQRRLHGKGEAGRVVRPG